MNLLTDSKLNICICLHMIACGFYFRTFFPSHFRSQNMRMICYNMHQNANQWLSFGANINSIFDYKMKIDWFIAAVNQKSHFSRTYPLFCRWTESNDWFGKLPKIIRPITNNLNMHSKSKCGWFWWIWEWKHSSLWTLLLLSITVI